MLLMKCIRMFAIVVLSLAASGLSASTGGTYVVGTCKPGLPSFTTLAAALAAAAPGYVISVCPGTYNEQLELTKSVTLQGLSTGNSSQVTIAPPLAGLVANATDSFGNSIAAQVWLNNAGVVNISNLTFDAAGSQIQFFPPYIVGIFYQDTGGTVNWVTTRNQQGNGEGRGIVVESGVANPSVTIENSNIHDFDNTGIAVAADAASSPYTALIKNNNLDGDGNFVTGLVVAYAGTVTVQNNVVTRMNTGVRTVGGVAGTISSNVFTNDDFGIVAWADAVSVSGNKIFDSALGAITLTSTAVTIQSNTIMNTPAGINFSCAANGNVRTNTIIDAATGLVNVPATEATTNSYFSVPTIRGGC